MWILLKQETVSGSGISWAVCNSAPCSRQTTTPAPHHHPSCRPTNSVKALKAMASLYYDTAISVQVLSTEEGPETPGDDETGTGSAQERELRGPVTSSS